MPQDRAVALAARRPSYSEKCPPSRTPDHQRTHAAPEDRHAKAEGFCFQTLLLPFRHRPEPPTILLQRVCDCLSCSHVSWQAGGRVFIRPCMRDSTLAERSNLQAKPYRLSSQSESTATERTRLRLTGQTVRVPKQLMPGSMPETWHASCSTSSGHVAGRGVALGHKAPEQNLGQATLGTHVLINELRSECFSRVSNAE